MIVVDEIEALERRLAMAKRKMSQKEEEEARDRGHRTPLVVSLEADNDGDDEVTFSNKALPVSRVETPAGDGIMSNGEGGPLLLSPTAASRKQRSETPVTGGGGGGGGGGSGGGKAKTPPLPPPRPRPWPRSRRLLLPPPPHHNTSSLFDAQQIIIPNFKIKVLRPTSLPIAPCTLPIAHLPPLENFMKFVV